MQKSRNFDSTEKICYNSKKASKKTSQNSRKLSLCSSNEEESNSRRLHRCEGMNYNVEMKVAIKILTSVYSMDSNFEVKTFHVRLKNSC